MFGILILLIFWGAIAKLAVENHEKYKKGNSDGIPFWVSPIAFIFAPVILVIVPASFGVPWPITLPGVIAYFVIAIRAVSRASAAKKHNA